MKGIFTKALLVTLVVSPVQSFSMVEAIKQKAGVVMQGAQVLAHKALEAGKAQPYTAAGICLGALGALGLTKYAYSKYQARKTLARDAAMALQMQREQFIDAIVESVARAKAANNPAVFAGNNHRANMTVLAKLCTQQDAKQQYAACVSSIQLYALALEELNKAIQKKQNSTPLVQQAEAQHAEVVKQLNALKNGSTVTQPASKLAQVARWTGISALAAGAAYGAFKVWNWFRA